MDELPVGLQDQDSCKHNRMLVNSWEIKGNQLTKIVATLQCGDCKSIFLVEGWKYHTRSLAAVKEFSE